MAMLMRAHQRRYFMKKSNLCGIVDIISKFCACILIFFWEPCQILLALFFWDRLVNSKIWPQKNEKGTMLTDLARRHSYTSIIDHIFYYTLLWRVSLNLRELWTFPSFPWTKFWKYSLCGNHLKQSTSCCKCWWFSLCDISEGSGDFFLLHHFPFLSSFKTLITLRTLEKMNLLFTKLRFLSTMEVTDWMVQFVRCCFSGIWRTSLLLNNDIHSGIYLVRAFTRIVRQLFLIRGLRQYMM